MGTFRTTRLAFVSDTHGLHSQLTTAIIEARAEVLVHCGDFTSTGRMDQMHSFADWCAMLLRKDYVKHVIAVAGNHDLTLDETHPLGQGTAPETARFILKEAGVQYLQDSGCEVASIKFYGTPWTPRFYDWAFQIDSDEQDRRIFRSDILGGSGERKIDVLVTHGPPAGIRDLTNDGRSTGSQALREAVLRKSPRIHAFGHLHCNYGISLHPRTLFINAATCTEAYKPTNPPITVEFFT